MIVATLQDVLTSTPDTIIPAFRGTIKAVFDHYTGVSEHGPWAMQNIIVESGGGEIKVKLKDREKMPVAWKGKAVVFQAYSGKKGMSGIKAADDTYKGKTSRILSVTGSAVIETGTGEFLGKLDKSNEEPPQPSDVADTQDDIPFEESTDSFPPFNIPQPAQVPVPPKPVSSAEEQALAKDARLYCRCLDAAVFVATHMQEKHSLTLPEVAIKDIATSLFIQRLRN